MEITPSWPQDTWNVNIWPFGWEICKTVKCPKMTIFRRPEVMKIIISFRLTVKSLEMIKIITSWTQDTWNRKYFLIRSEYGNIWNAQKWQFFAGNVQFFRLSGKPLKMMEITPSWRQDTWNVNICPFVWEMCKNVKCPKMTIFRMSAVLKILFFFIFCKTSYNDENHHQSTTGHLKCKYLMI